MSIRFRFDTKDVQKFRASDSYRLEQIRLPDDMRAGQILPSTHPRRRFQAPAPGNATSPSASPWAPPSPVGMDNSIRCSIFIGNLPASTDEQGIYEHFVNFGGHPQGEPLS